MRHVRELVSRGQAVQGVQSEEDVRFTLEGARAVLQQLAALQVRRDVFQADGLQDIREERNDWMEKFDLLNFQILIYNHFLFLLQKKKFRVFP